MPFGERGAEALPVPRAARGDGAPGRRGVRPEAPARAPLDASRGDAARAGVPDRRAPVPRHRGRAFAAGLDARRASGCSSARGARRRRPSCSSGRRSSRSPISTPRCGRSARSSSRARALAATGRTPTTDGSSGSGTSTTRSARPIPSFEPARPVLAAFTRQPFDITDPVTVITDPADASRSPSSRRSATSSCCTLLTRFFTHTDETDEQLRLLFGTAIELMARHRPAARPRR